jgi:ribosomal protein L11 methylase PrmA
MASALAGALARPGVVVLSGFLERDGDRVLAAHRRRGLRAWRRITIDRWQTLVLKR